MSKFLAPNFFLLLKARNMPNGIEQRPKKQDEKENSMDLSPQH
jgi:hypothetical protein